MKQYAFAGYHPVVNLIFFLSIFCFSVLIQHPVYLVANGLGSVIYCFMLEKKRFLSKAIKLFYLLLFLTLINPLLNTRGDSVLFRIFGRPYTLEALVYGFVVGCIFVVVLMWLDCYNQIFARDKFVFLFSSFMPTIALILSMIFRLIPSFQDKAGQIAGARTAIGKGLEASSKKDSIKQATIVLGALVSWALENSVVTGDSMKARGYGIKKRSTFKMYHMTFRDWLLIIAMCLLIWIVTVSIVTGNARAEFVPKIDIAVIDESNILGFIAYCVLLAIPILIHIKEKVSWSISEYKI
ncbi:MAG: energy-coupling factor transporter transmembrane protein EcfT [Lachnospiraceae bacterium]|nr:energy-coupling factor transporter transmembrane protein EcfT [Lachnospiraceae bacterium]